MAGNRVPAIQLNRAEATKSLASAQQALGELATDTADISVCLFSALSRKGLGDAALVLRTWLPRPGAAGAAIDTARDAATSAMTSATTNATTNAASDAAPGTAPPLSPA